MSEESSFSNYPSYGEKNVRKSHFVAIFFIILLVVIIILVGLYFLGASKKGSLKVIPSATPTHSSGKTGSGQAPTTAQQVTATPTLTPTPATLDRSKLNVVVLNGSGVAGAAQNISTTLSDLGYTVKSVGNASKFDYVGVTIFIKTDKKEYLDMLKKDLAKKAPTITANVDDTIKNDAEIIVGK